MNTLFLQVDPALAVPFTQQFTASATIVFLIQLAKKIDWLPWIHENSDKLNRLIAVFASGITALGIHFSWDATTGTATITGLTIATVGHGLWDWIQSFAVQEFVYRSTKRAKGDGTAFIPKPEEKAP